MDNYKDISLESIQKAVSDFFGNVKEITYQELRDKILPGYNYKIKVEGDKENQTRSTSIYTGQGGVLLCIDEYEKTGLPAGFAATAIYVNIDGKDYCILDLNIKQNKQ